MNKETKYLVILILLVFSIQLSGQKQGKRKILLGLSINPIIPNNMIQNNDVLLQTDTMDYGLFQKTGLSYGMDIRYEFHERFSLHTGINYTHRRFKVEINSRDSVFADTTLKFISYDIPIYLAGYVKLEEHLYLNGNLGLSMDFYPTDIAVPHVYGKRYHWAQFSVIGGTGLELRTWNSGYFYLGMSYKAHFHDMLYVLFYKESVIGVADEYIPCSGNYFSINVKYYFP